MTGSARSRSRLGGLGAGDEVQRCRDEEASRCVAPDLVGYEGISSLASEIARSDVILQTLADRSR